MYDNNYDDYEPGDYEDDSYEDGQDFPDLISDDYRDQELTREENDDWGYEPDQSEYEIQTCRNCGREINANNRSIDGVMCQACQGDGCRRLIIFDWFAGGRFFG